MNSVFNCPECPSVQPNKEIIERLREIIDRQPNALMMSAKMDASVGPVVLAGPPECENCFQSMLEISNLLNEVTS